MSKEIKRIKVASGDLVGIPQHNFAKHESLFDNETRRNEHAVMLHQGWDTAQEIRVVKVPETLHATILTFLEAIWKAIQGNTVESSFPIQDGEKRTTTLTPAEMREGFAATYMEKGKIVVPQYEIVYGFQRVAALWVSNALRLKLGLKELLHVPVIVMDYSGDEAQRIQDCIAENFRKTVGFNAKVLGNHQTWVKMCHEYFKAARKNPTLSNVTQLISQGSIPPKVGAGQETFPILALHSRFPNLGILDKALDSTPILDAKNKPTGLTKGEEWLIAVSAGQDKRKSLRDLLAGTEEGAKGEMLKTPKDVEDYFTNPVKASGGHKMMTRTAILNIINLTANRKLKYVLKAVIGMAPEDVSVVLEPCNKTDNADMDSLGLEMPAKAEIRESVATTPA